jgi:superfamily I DNA and/or RNA helicase
VGQSQHVTVYIVVKFSLYHIKMRFLSLAGLDYESIVSGWVYDTTRTFSEFNKMRGNIYTLVTDPRYQRMADLVAAEKKPEFEKDIGKVERFDKFGSSLGPHLKQNLNGCQRNVLEQSLNAKDYSLILGMPGTGKTFTTCMLLKILLEKGKRVLITSYTHLGIDNIILKFLEIFADDKKSVARMVASSSNASNPKISSIIYDNKKQRSFDEISKFLDEKKIIFTTSLSTGNPILKSRKFDYVIVDEASQTVEPIMLASLFFADKFVLIGDYFQLSPIIKSAEATDLGMAISLFERLCKKHPSAVTYLDIQYRMNADIVTLCNELVYDGKLKTAPEVGNSRLDFSQRLEGSQTNNYLDEKVLWVKEI